MEYNKSQNKFQDGIYSFTGPNFDQNCLTTNGCVPYSNDLI